MQLRWISLVVVKAGGERLVGVMTGYTELFGFRYILLCWWVWFMFGVCGVSRDVHAACGAAVGSSPDLAQENCHQRQRSEYFFSLQGELVRCGFRNLCQRDQAAVSEVGPAHVQQ